MNMTSGIIPAGGGVPTRLVVEAYQPEEDVCPLPSPSTVLYAAPGRVAASTCGHRRRQPVGSGCS